MSSKRGRSDADAEAEAEALRNREERMDPVSLEDLLGAKKMEQDELAKPKFLSTEDRAQMAIRKREAQMAARRAQQEEQAEARQAMREAERRERDQGGRRGRQQAPTEKSTDVLVLEAIRSQYLGSKPKKKKVLKPSEKFKFSFDWDMNEDTSRDLNPLYQDSELTDDTGRRAGIDVREQQQQNEFYENLVAQRLAEQEKIRKKEKKERKRQRQAEREAAAAAGEGGEGQDDENQDKSEDDEDDE